MKESTIIALTAKASKSGQDLVHALRTVYRRNKHLEDKLQEYGREIGRLRKQLTERTGPEAAAASEDPLSQDLRELMKSPVFCMFVEKLRENQRR